MFFTNTLMRMKRMIILAAVAAIAATACTKTFEVQPTPERSIGFGSWANVLTKARTAGSSTFTAGDDFNVYGFKTLSGSGVNVFNGEEVSTADGTTWTYTNTRYWDPSATSYTFFAVSPKDMVATATASGGVVTGAFTSNSITFAGNDNDVLVADKKVVANADFNNTVALQFNHIASLVDFKAKKHADLADATVAITSFSLTNMDNTGTFSVADTYASSNHPDVTWNATAHTGTYSNTSGVTSVATLPDDIGTTGDFLINNLVAMPQTFRTDANIQTVSIEYTITDQGGNTSAYTASFNLKLFDDVDDTDNEDTIIPGWEGGKHYTFFITINSNAIVFSATITDWVTTDATGYNYLLQ